MNRKPTALTPAPSPRPRLSHMLSSISPSTPTPTNLLTPTPILTSDPSPRNPRIHRQSGIPSVSRPRGSSPNTGDGGLSPAAGYGIAPPRTLPRTPTAADGDVHSSLSRKKTGYGLLSVTPNPNPHLDYDDPSGRRVVSMPHPRFSTFPSTPQTQTQLDITADRLSRSIRHGTNPPSPPLVDFTRFEDAYRGPRNGVFEGLVAGSSSKGRSSSAGFAVGRGFGDSGGGRGRGRGRGRGGAGMPMKSAMKKRSVPALQLNVSSEVTPDVGFSMDMSAASSIAVHPAPASTRKPDPRLILKTLEDVLASAEDGSAEEVLRHLDVYDLLGAHQLDQLDFEERDRLRVGCVTGENTRKADGQRTLAVLGEPIRKASIYASTTTVLGGREHELPIVVVHCVEELYRTGIYQPNLFRALPNRARLLELIDIFDSEVQPPGSIIRSRSRSARSATGYSSSSASSNGYLHGESQSSTSQSQAQVVPMMGFGTATSLHLESTPDICALLATYLSSLPEPVLSPGLFDAIWEACGIGEDEDEDEDEDMSSTLPSFSSTPSYAAMSTSLCRSRPHSRSRMRLSSVPLARTYTAPADATHVLAAQLLLHLLPSAHFSLLVYLLAFFSQVALVREENGVGVEDLGRMFGGKMFGGSTMSSAGKGKGKGKAKEGEDIPAVQTRRRGETMMVWFLRRWSPLSETLFEVVEDAKMGMMRRNRALRRDSLGRNVLGGRVLQKCGGNDHAHERDQQEEEDEDEDEADNQERTALTPDASPSSPTSASKSESRPNASSCPPLMNKNGSSGSSFLPSGFSSSSSSSSRASLLTPLPRIRLEGLDADPVCHSTPRGKGNPSARWKTSVFRDGDNELERSRGGRSSPPVELEEEEGVDIVDDASNYVIVTPTAPSSSSSNKERNYSYLNAHTHEDSLDVPQLSSRIQISSSRDSASVYSTAALDERLLDISMPALLNQTLPTLLQDQDDTPRRRHTQIEREFSSCAVQTGPDTDRILREAQTDVIAHLESQLLDRARALTEAQEALAHYAVRCAQLEERIRVLDAAVSGPVKGAPGEETGDAVRGIETTYLDAQAEAENVRKERDAAREIVSEIKRLVGRN